MGIFDFFTKKSEEEFDPLSGLSLPNLKVGYFVDYEGKTFEVTAHHRYKYEEGDEPEDEWELTSGNEVLFLSREEDDEAELTICKKIPIGLIQENVRKEIQKNDDPPGQITVESQTFYMDESGPAYFFKDTEKNGMTGEGEGFIYWTFIDSDDESFITIEQWGESDIEAVKGSYVKDYHFSNILPGGAQGR